MFTRGLRLTIRRRLYKTAQAIFFLSSDLQLWRPCGITLKISKAYNGDDANSLTDNSIHTFLPLLISCSKANPHNILRWCNVNQLSEMAAKSFHARSAESIHFTLSRHRFECCWVILMSCVLDANISFCLRDDDDANMFCCWRQLVCM